MRAKSPALLVLVLLLALLPVSCSRSTTSQYFYLTPLDSAEQTRTNGPAIGVAMVAIPGYADRNMIVTAMGGNRLTMDDKEQWAEPLDENVTRVLSENLGMLLGTDRVEVDTWPSGAVDYRVEVRVIRLMGEPGGRATLDARWSIIPEGRDAPPVLGRTQESSSAGPDTASYVAALSGLLEEMSRQIAAAIP